MNGDSFSPELKFTETTYRSYPESFLIRKKAIVRLVAGLFFVCNSLSGMAQYGTAKSYIIHYAPLAQSFSSRTGIPASVILGIALIESGHGSSPNCRILKNHFGIKGKNHLAHYQSGYRSYRSDEASFGHFCTVIKRKAYYRKLRGEKDYSQWLQHINSKYYSSAGKIWVHKVREAIRIHRLYRFDTPGVMLSQSPRMNWMHA